MFFLKKNLSIFSCAGSSLLCRLFSSCSEQGLLSLGVRTSGCGGFSCCGARASEHLGSVAEAPRLWNTSSIVVAAAATAKSLQSCPTLCNPIDSSPPGSTVPGILQARTLEWVAISFSNA